MPSLQELLVDDLRDIYDAEKQGAKALPRLAKVASSQELKQALLEHAEMTKGQVARLEQIFEIMGERAKSKPCKAMKGLVEEANEHLQEHQRGHELDAVLTASSQKMEHYEIAAYGTARSYAKSLGQKEVMNLLAETLKEEEMTDKLLSKVGVQIQKEMLQEEGEEESGADEQMGRYEQESRRATGKRGSQSSGAARGGTKKKVAAKNAGGRAGSSRKGASARGGNGRASASSNVTTDHEQIRLWAEERGAHPACVRGTGGKGDTGMIRLDFPGYTGGDSLEEISWDEFFEKFDEQGLALLYQEQTSGGQKSNFNKLIARETAELREKGGRGSARRGR